MRRSRAAAFGVAFGSIAWLGSCADGSVDPPAPLAEGVILSDPAVDEGASLARRRAPGGAAFSFAAQTTSDETDVAYISLPSGSYPEGALARIRGSSTDGTVTAPMIEGGLDPVPVRASEGDSVEIEILDAGLVAFARAGSRVPRTRRPRVVRTVPPRGKTDVSVNAIIVIVFSEPIDPSSLSSSAIRLMRGGTAVAGTASPLAGVTAAVAFQPSEPLAPNAGYTMVVTQGVRDLDGDPLEAELTLEFTSGTEFAPNVSMLTVLPEAAALAVGSRAQFVALAASGDDTTRSPVPIAGVPILWSSDNPDVATVSTTGLVTAMAVGEVRIRAQVLSNVAVSGTGRVIVSGSLVPVASLELLPSSDTIPATGKILLSATARDVDGNVLEFRPVAWSTANSGVATVEPAPSGKAWVTGVAPGSVSIIAVSEGKADTATVQVASAGPYTTLSAGGVSGILITCGLREPGWAFCWGSNAAGQVGDGSSNSWSLPHPVVGALPFSQLSAGGNNTCAVTNDGEAYCWGANAVGGLGIGTVNGPEQCEFSGACSRVPLAVSGGLRFTEIRVSHAYYGAFVCGRTSNGSVYCWGDNSLGQLGIASTTGPEACLRPGQQTPSACSTVPVAVAGDRTYRALTLGGAQACALTDDGAAYCWGDNLAGQLGDGTTSRRSTPVAVAGGLTFVSISAGTYHTCAVGSDGGAFCWGLRGADTLGTTPARVPGSIRWSAISAGESHTCALDSSGAAYCWGRNDLGQLGTGTTESSAAPAAVVGGLTFANLTTSALHTCGVTIAGVAYCWGSNEHLALGNDDTFPGNPVPIRVEGQP